MILMTTMIWKMMRNSKKLLDNYEFKGLKKLNFKVKKKVLKRKLGLLEK